MSKDELIPDETGAILTPVSDAKRDSLSGFSRVLHESDMKVAGVQKMVLARLDDAEKAVKRLENFRTNYYATREELVVAQCTLKRINSLEVLQDGALATGSVMFGFLPSAWGNWQLMAMLVAGFLIAVTAYLKSKSAGLLDASKKGSGQPASFDHARTEQGETA